MPQTLLTKQQPFYYISWIQQIRTVGRAQAEQFCFSWCWLRSFSGIQLVDGVVWSIQYGTLVGMIGSAVRLHLESLHMTYSEACLMVVIFLTWQLRSPWVKVPREPDECSVAFLTEPWKSHSVISTAFCWLWHKVSPDSRGEGLYAISWWGSGKVTLRRACGMELLL